MNCWGVYHESMSSLHPPVKSRHYSICICDFIEENVNLLVTQQKNKVNESVNLNFSRKSHRSP